MQIAIVAAGFTPGEADQLRRAMGAWQRSGKMDMYKDKAHAGNDGANGYTDKFAEQIYKQIEGFGEYGFPESHSASFALLTYKSSWLKCHRPAAFFAGLINSQPMGFYQPAQLLEQAKRQDVTDTAGRCHDERLGLHARARLRTERLCASDLGCDWCKGCARSEAQRIVAARAERASLRSVETSRIAQHFRNSAPGAGNGRRISQLYRASQCGAMERPGRRPRARAHRGSNADGGKHLPASTERMGRNSARLQPARASAPGVIRSQCCARSCAKWAVAQSRGAEFDRRRQTCLRRRPGHSPAASANRQGRDLRVARR